MSSSGKKRASPSKKEAGANVSQKTAQTAALPRIEKTMTVSAILRMLPDAEPILAEYGLHCFHCAANTMENLEDGCRTHGFDDREIAALVDDLNLLLTEKPARSHTLSLTAPAARALRGIVEHEGKEDHYLEVMMDDSGSFCMEFQKDRSPDAEEFSNADVPDMKIFASAMTLGQIGGGAIDFRDGRFKLDLPEDRQNDCGCDGKGCKC